MFQRIAALCLLPLAGAAVGCSGEVKLGALISETGAVSTYGQRVKKGIDLALDEVNAAGGFEGKTIQIVYRDDMTNVDAGLKAAKSLIDEEGVNIIIGAVSSQVTLKIAPLCEKEKVVLLSPASSAPSISEAGNYIFRNYPSDIIEVTSMADFARDLGLERVVIFAAANEFGAGQKEIFKRSFESRSRKVVETFDVADDATDALAGMVKQVSEIKPDGIYIVAYVDTQVALLEQLHAAGVRAVLLSSGAVTDDVVRRAGAAAENLVYAQPSFDLESEDPAVASFVKAYRAKYDENPDIYAAHGYDALKLIVTAMETGGSAHANAVMLGLGNIDGYDGAAGRTGFDANGDVVRYPRMFIVQQGRAVPYEQFEEQGGKLPLAGRS